MQGFPPPADKTIRFSDGSHYRFPNFRWAFSHERELLPTASVWRGYSPVSVLPRAERNLDNVAYKLADGKDMTWAGMLAAYTKEQAEVWKIAVRDSGMPLEWQLEAGSESGLTPGLISRLGWQLHVFSLERLVDLAESVGITMRMSATQARPLD